MAPSGNTRLSAADKAAVYTHVVHDILKFATDGDMDKALKEQKYNEDPKLLFNFTETELDAIEYKASDGTPRAPPQAHISKLRIFRNFVKYEHSQNPNFKPRDILNKSGDNFDSFTVGINATYFINTNPPPISSAGTKTYTVEELWEKGIKRSRDTFPILKNDDYFENWQIEFEAEARTQFMQDVLDPNYKPVKLEDVTKFHHRKVFMYDVFVLVLKTVTSKPLVTTYKTSKDGQQLYMDLLEVYERSTKGKIKASELLTYVTTTKLDSSWRNTYESFIVYFDQKLQLHDKLNPHAPLMGNAEVLLQNAVKGVPELAAIEITADQISGTSGTGSGYSEYLKHVTKAAIRLDNARNPIKGKIKAPPRKIYNHELQWVDPFDYGEPDPAPDDIVFDLDTSPSLILAHQANHKLREQSSDQDSGTRVPSQQWEGLTSAGKTAWRQIPIADRALILGKAAPKSAPRQAHQHDIQETDNSPDPLDLDNISASQYLALQHHFTQAYTIQEASQSSPSNPSVAIIKPKKTPVDVKKLPVGDPRRMLAPAGPSTKPNPTTATPRQVNAINIGGKLYAPVQYDVNMNRCASRSCNLQCTASESAATSKRTGRSLMDRGANGGVKGDQGTVIAVYPHKFVDIQGVKNHTVNNIQLGTVGGLTHTNFGPVILVVTYYAITGEGTTIHSCGQWEHHGAKVDERAISVGGTQTITFPGDIAMPVDIVSSLACIKWEAFSTDEWNTLPHLIVTPENIRWDPRVLDRRLTESLAEWLQAHPPPNTWPANPAFDAQGNYQRRTVLAIDTTDPAPEDTYDQPIWQDAWDSHSVPSQVSSQEIIEFSDDLELPHPDNDTSILDFYIVDDPAHPTLAEVDSSSDSLSVPDLSPPSASDAYSTDSDPSLAPRPVRKPRVFTVDTDGHTIVSQDSFHSVSSGHTYQSWDDDSVHSLLDHMCADNSTRFMFSNLHDIFVDADEPPFDDDDSIHPYCACYSTHIDPDPDLCFFDASPDELKDPPFPDPPPEAPLPDFDPTIATPKPFFHAEYGEPDTGAVNPDHRIRPRTTKPIKRNWKVLRPFFAWLGLTIIEKTFNNTTQMARMPNEETLRRHFRSPNPATNVPRRNECVATDTIFSDAPAIDSGATCSQTYIGLHTRVRDNYGMKREAMFVNTLKDNTRNRGAPTALLSDNAQSETSQRVLDILRAYMIMNFHSEAYQQFQNYAERGIQTVKNHTNLLLDRTGAPAFLWLECVNYVCYVLNHTWCEVADAIPLQLLTGQTIDISALLRFHWCQEVCFRPEDNHFPSQSPELKGRIVGVATNVGHILTYRVHHEASGRILCRSNLRPVSSDRPNLRLDQISGEDFSNPAPDVVTTVQTKRDLGNKNADLDNMPIGESKEPVRKTFLMDEQEDGQRHRAKIVDAIKEHDKE